MQLTPLPKTIRTATARVLVPVLAVTGWRFSKAYRHGETIGHKAIYAAVDVIQANGRAMCLADRVARRLGRDEVTR